MSTARKSSRPPSPRAKDPQAYCDALAADWKAFAKKLELTNDDFVRTTEPRHKEFVQAILRSSTTPVIFTRRPTTGFYSAKEETFLTEKDRLPDGTFDPSYGEVVELKEENYYFRLGAHQQWLIDFIEANPDFIAAGLSPQRSPWLSQEQHARRFVHLASGGAAELGHSPALRQGFRHLRLVRRARELHQHCRDGIALAAHPSLGISGRRTSTSSARTS
jgi:hypothetical protein